MRIMASLVHMLGSFAMTSAPSNGQTARNDHRSDKVCLPHVEYRRSSTFRDALPFASSCCLASCSKSPLAHTLFLELPRTIPVSVYSATSTNLTCPTITIVSRFISSSPSQFAAVPLTSSTTQNVTKSSSPCLRTPKGSSTSR